MDLSASRIVLRPRSMSEILDLSFRYVWGGERGLFLWLSALLLLPCLAITLAAHYLLDWDWWWTWSLALVLGSIVQGPFTIAAGRTMFERGARVRDVLRAFGGRFFPYLGALIASRVLLGLGWLGFFTVVLPVWVWSRLAHVHEACLLEQAGPIDAITRASRFAQAPASRALPFVVAICLAQPIFVLSAETLLNAGLMDFVLQVGTPFGTLWENGGTPFALIGFFASIPYAAVARFLTYVDTRTRQDGWDIQVRFMAVQQTAPEGDAVLGEAQ